MKPAGRCILDHNDPPVPTSTLDLFNMASGASAAMILQILSFTANVLVAGYSYETIHINSSRRATGNQRD